MDKDEICSFYRQGQAFVVPRLDLENYRFERMTERNLGQMIYFEEKALIARSSSKILFFRQEVDSLTHKIQWK